MSGASDIHSEEEKPRRRDLSVQSHQHIFAYLKLTRRSLGVRSENFLKLEIILIVAAVCDRIWYLNYHVFEKIGSEIHPSWSGLVWCGVCAFR